MQAFAAFHDPNQVLAFANAVLTTGSTLCMTLGYVAIRRKQVARHRRFMLAAFGLAALFMALFVLRFVKFGPTQFLDHALPARIAFYALYFTHEPLAVLSVPLVVVAAVLGWRGALRTHREVARMALPIWAYSSVTGVALFFFLYTQGAPK